MRQLSLPSFVVLLAASLLMAAVLAVLRTPLDMPGWLAAARPLWLHLLVVFWVLAAPTRFGVIAAWCVGLMADALLAAPLGANAASAVLLAWMCQRARGVMIAASSVQQAFILVPLFLLVVALQIGAAWIAGGSEPRWALFLAAPSSALVWPLVVLTVSGGRPFQPEPGS